MTERKNTTAAADAVARSDAAWKHEREHREDAAASSAKARRARVFLVIDASDALDEPSTATAHEAADALQIDMDALLWAIEAYGRCDGEGGLLVVPLTGHDA